MNIYEKLSAIQQELKAPKSQYNSFGKYAYRNCEDIFEAAKPICAKYGAVLTVSDDIKLVGDRYYIVASVRLTDAEKPESFILVTAQAREEDSKKGMDASQVSGASSSYARKYALNGIFNIDDTKDSDTTNQGGASASAPRKPAAPPQEEQIICENCMRPISPATIGGKTYTPRQIANTSRKNYGLTLCADCAKKVKEEANA